MCGVKGHSGTLPSQTDSGVMDSVPDGTQSSSLPVPVKIHLDLAGSVQLN